MEQKRAIFIYLVKNKYYNGKNIDELFEMIQGKNRPLYKMEIPIAGIIPFSTSDGDVLKIQPTSFYSNSNDILWVQIKGQLSQADVSKINNNLNTLENNYLILDTKF